MGQLTLFLYKKNKKKKRKTYHERIILRQIPIAKIERQIPERREPDPRLKPILLLVVLVIVKALVEKHLPSRLHLAPRGENPAAAGEPVAGAPMLRAVVCEVEDQFPD